MHKTCPQRKHANMSVKAIRSAIAALCAAVTLAACSGPDMQQAHPALWQVSDDDTVLYLLGTMHALPDHMEWQTKPVRDAIAAADMLILELSPSQSSQAGAIFSKLAPRTAPLPIADRLNPAALAGYKALPLSQRMALSDTLDDWALMLILGQKAAQEANLSSTIGVEAQLTKRFSAAKKPISGLETAEAQLMIFETLSPATQRQLLNTAMAKAHSAPDDVRALLSAWAKGDLVALERKINEDVDTAPDAYGRLITDRNQRWAAWAVRRMDKPGTIFLAVGAGHMVGPDGLPALLQQRGLTVKRLQ